MTIIRYNTSFSRPAKQSAIVLLLLSLFCLPATAQQNLFGDQWVHVAEAANITIHTTELNHPYLDGNPNAIVFAIPVFNPPGVTTPVYNDNAIGVYYAEEKWRIFNQNFAALPEAAAFNMIVPSPSSVAFVHTADEDNIFGHVTQLDHPDLNGNPDAELLITQNWNPNGQVNGIYNDQSLGLWYTTDRWHIFNQNRDDMPEGASFNVMIAGDEASHFVHRATMDNITNQSTALDHPLLNNNPNAFISITQNWNPGGTGGTYNDQEVGVWYSGSSNRWLVFNQSRETMPDDAAFNVIIHTQPDAWEHTATSDNILNNYTLLDHPALNNNPDAVVFATQNFNPGGFGNTYNVQNTGVWYNGTRWAIFNQSQEAMPDKASFTVLVPGSTSASFKHKATSDNISGNVTILDHPSLNGNPDAVIFVTSNWGGNDGDQVYNDRPIGVYYASNAWRVFNQEGSSMPENAVFNVLIQEDGDRSFTFTATASDISNNAATFSNTHTNNNPKALVTATQNWTPHQIYNYHGVGVFYDLSAGRWGVFNEDQEALPTNASFNVLVYGESSRGVANEENHTVPESFALNQNFPNPFNPTTTISYDVATLSEVELTVYNMMGQEIRTLVSGTQTVGSYEAVFDATGLASGTYLYRLTVGNQTQSKVMMLLK